MSNVCYRFPIIFQLAKFFGMLVPHSHSWYNKTLIPSTPCLIHNNVQVFISDVNTTVLWCLKSENILLPALVAFLLLSMCLLITNCLAFPTEQASHGIIGPFFNAKSGRILIVAKSENILLPALVAFLLLSMCLLIANFLAFPTEQALHGIIGSFLRTIPIPVLFYMVAPYHYAHSLCEPFQFSLLHLYYYELH